MTEPTPLAHLLRRRIESAGPMTMAEYISACLLHPEHGYYTGQAPFGRSGDFVTAPEVSQMFGELLGLWLAQSWLDRGTPEQFILAELGPGRGTLMQDALRAAAQVPGFAAAAELWLVEASPRLREEQRARLADHAPQWVDNLADLPEGPLYLIANEFFDALPLRQFQRQEEGWRERVIGLRDGGLCIGLSDPITLPELEAREPDTSPGQIVEIRAPAAALTEEVARRIADRGGVALVVDYGDWRSRGDTLQALRDHRPEDPLANPGLADVTAHVDFEALAAAARSAGTEVTQMLPQGVFLERLGITQRAQALASRMGGDELENHVAAHRRLTHPDEMGSLFKALAIYSADTPAPAGFHS